MQPRAPSTRQWEGRVPGYKPGARNHPSARALGANWVPTELFVPVTFCQLKLTWPPPTSMSTKAYAVTRSNGGGVAEWLKAAVC